ncbi:MAG: RsmB/NOP family class I SAM-dependent RNA methyltransferase [Rhodospirillaceae bacterium]
MTPAARLQASIELLETILEQDRPADAVLAHYFKGRRFFGAKDRRAVQDQVWQIIRHRARLSWALGAENANARMLVAASLVAIDKRPMDSVAGLFSGAKNGPAPLAANEKRMVEKASSRKLEDAPRAARLECPAWILEKFEKAFGADTDKEVAALGGEAPLDLRVNTLKTTREAVIAQLESEKLKVSPARLSPLGIRVAGRTTLGNHLGFKEGLFEVQDEGSQLCAALVDAKPGMSVMDLCAGAGGKTLALAAQMKNKGRLIACDLSVARLERSKLRLRRAGVHNATLRVLEEHDKWLKRQTSAAGGSFDRVLVDAPCTGTGAWRRNPDARWRLKPGNLANLMAIQDAVLEQGAQLTRAGGRLIYVTCSLLPDENEERVAAFLARNGGFTALDAAGIWADVLSGQSPVPGPYLTFSPVRTGTDGFFIAILERSS